jgi:hypothetical protein
MDSGLGIPGSRFAPRNDKGRDNLTQIATFPVRLHSYSETAWQPSYDCDEPGGPLGELNDYKSESILNSRFPDFIVRPEFLTCSFCSRITFSILTGAS